MPQSDSQSGICRRKKGTWQELCASGVGCPARGRRGSRVAQSRVSTRVRPGGCKLVLSKVIFKTLCAELIEWMVFPSSV